MALHAFAYYSRAVPGLSSDNVYDMVREAAARNRIAGVTGVLLSDTQRFLQYIEGPEDGVALTVQRILGSKLHIEIVELARGQVGTRRFPYWSMRWIQVGESELEAAAFSEWDGLAHRENSPARIPTGVDRVKTLVQPYVN